MQRWRRGCPGLSHATPCRAGGGGHACESRARGRERRSAGGETEESARPFNIRDVRVDVSRGCRGESDETGELVARLAPYGLTTEALRKLVYGDAGKTHAFRELNAAAKLRKLGLITRNDGGSEELHDETAKTWTLAERVLAWLYGDESVDPSLSTLLSPATCSESPLSIPSDTVMQVVDAMRAVGSGNHRPWRTRPRSSQPHRGCSFRCEG